MEINPFNQARSLSWRILRLTRTAGLVQTTLECFVPSEYAKKSLRLREEVDNQRQVDEAMLLAVGELTLSAYRDESSLDTDALALLWQAVLQGKAGVEIHEVFDPHKAALLRHLVPALNEAGLAIEAESEAAIINNVDEPSTYLPPTTAQPGGPL